MTGPRAQRGFTLVELLVGLTILALIALLSVEGLRSVQRLWLAAERSSAAAIDAASVRDVVRALFEGAYPLTISQDPERISFAGAERSIELTGELPAQAGAGGHYRIRLSADGAVGFASLRMSWRPEHGSSAEAAPGGATASETFVALVPGVAGLGFAYFGRLGRDEGPGWHAQWAEQTRLPDLIRLELEFPPGDTRSWPPFVVEIKVNAPARCRYDIGARRCKPV